MKKIISLLMALIVSVCMWANGTLIGHLYYNLDVSTQTAEVTHYHDLSQNYLGETSITIPPTVEYENTTYTVSRIGDWAFSYCYTLTTIIMPNTITSVGNAAFENCPNIVSPIYNAHVFAYLPKNTSGSYSIPNGITSIAGSAFKNCTGLTSVEIPNGITEIGESAFESCSGLLALELPNSLKRINFFAFQGCNHIPSIEIPSSVERIENYAFAECTGMLSLKFNEGVSYIGNFAFNYCTGLTSLTLPRSLTSLENYVFLECSSLKYVIIPSSFQFFRDGSFSGCTSLTSVYCYASEPPMVFGDNLFGGIDCSKVPLYVPAESVETYGLASVWQNFTPIKAIGAPDTIDCNVTYLEKEGSVLDTKKLELIVPVAPLIDGFTFMYWKTLEGNIDNGISIQAIYKYNGSLTALPSEVINPANPSQKLIRDGNVYILRGDHTYTVDGRLVR